MRQDGEEESGRVKLQAGGGIVVGNSPLGSGLLLGNNFNND